MHPDLTLIETPGSTNVARIGFIPVEPPPIVRMGVRDKQMGVLTVAFKRGGVYLYEWISSDEFDDFKTAQSKGRWLSEWRKARGTLLRTHRLDPKGPQ